jgi:hypothetical protein
LRILPVATVIGFCLRGRLVKSTPEMGHSKRELTANRSGLQLLLEAPREYGHFLCRLFVAAPLRNVDSTAVRVEGVAQHAGIGQGIAQQLPCRRIVRVHFECTPQLVNGDPRLLKFEIFAAKAESQQRRIFSLR